MNLIQLVIRATFPSDLRSITLPHRKKPVQRAALGLLKTAKDDVWFHYWVIYYGGGERMGKGGGGKGEVRSSLEQVISEPKKEKEEKQRL